jgi:PAS domain S-box-containing protein
MYLNDRGWMTLAWVAVMGALSVALNAAYQQGLTRTVVLTGLAGVLFIAALMATARQFRRQLALLEQQLQEQTTALRESEEKYLSIQNHIQHDSMDRRQAEQRIQTFSQAVEQSPASIVITDPKGRIEYVNRKFEAVSGYTQAEALGENPRVLKSGHQPPELYEELWKTIAAGHEWHGELCNQRKNGEVYWESAFAMNRDKRFIIWRSRKILPVAS